MNIMASRNRGNEPGRQELCALDGQCPCVLQKDIRAYLGTNESSL